MKDDIKPGDVVRLTGGGPLMTVEKVAREVLFDGTPTTKAHCAWFDDDLKLHRGDICVGALEVVPEDEIP